MKIWKAPTSIPERVIGPSSFFLELLERMDKVWNRNSEYTTRTYIDQVFIDVLWNRRNLPKGLVYRPYGEIDSKGKSKEGETYGGTSDYVMGYGDPGSNLMSFLILAEAKEFQGEMKPWQLFSMMAHYQKLRRKKTKRIIYGIFTDSQTYIFYRLDENSKIFRSRIYDFVVDKGEIWNFIDFLIDMAEKLSPTSTPYASQVGLFEDSGYLKYLEPFHFFETDYDAEDISDALKFLFLEEDL